MDEAGDVLDILVQPRRNRHAAVRFFRKLLKNQRQVPRRLITDKLRSYSAANRLYDDCLAIVSGNSRRYEAPTWVDWAPPPQLTHLFRIVGAGERT